MASRSGLTRRSDGWELPVAGFPITQLVLDYAVTLHIDAVDGLLEIRIEQPFVFTTTGGIEHLIVPEGKTDRIAPILAVVRSKVESARAYEDGRLEIIFEDGSRIGVPPSEGYEAWTATGPRNVKLVSLPGGTLETWTQSSSPPG